MEPDPSNYSNAQNYINALVNHWSRFGGPANQNRAISLRLQMYFNKLMTEARELRSRRWKENNQRQKQKVNKRLSGLMLRVGKFRSNNQSKFEQGTGKSYKMKQEIRERVLRNFFTKELPRAFQTQFKLPTEIVRKIISREVYPKSLHVAIPFRNRTRLPIMAYRNKRGDIYNIRWTEKGPFLQKMQRRNTNNRSNNENYRNSNTSNSNK